MATTSATATRVTGRRVLQYLIDLFLTGVVLTVLSLVADRVVPAAGFEQVNRGWRNLSGLTAVAGLPSLSAALLTGAVWLVVFVGVPLRWGRTPAMALLGLWIVRLDGGRPTPAQHVVRGLLLAVDGMGGGVVGWVVIVCSGQRQRIGDHAAGTLVVDGPRPGRVVVAGVRAPS